jgi:hypothetical protein
MHVLGVIDHQLPLQPVMIFLYEFDRFAFDHKVCSFVHFRNTFFPPCTGICVAILRISYYGSAFCKFPAYRVKI